MYLNDKHIDASGCFPQYLINLMSIYEKKSLKCSSEQTLIFHFQAWISLLCCDKSGANEVNVGVYQILTI